MLNPGICVVNFGDTLTSLTGIMYYSFSAMKLIPRNNDDMPTFWDPIDNVERPAFSGQNCPLPNGLNFPTVENEDLFAGSEINVYPNPTSNILNVEYSMNQLVEATVELRDLMGRQVEIASFAGQNGRLQLNTADLAEGTYVLVVRTADAIISQSKVLIIR